MAKLKDSLANMFLSLTGICLVVGALLGWVSSVTAEPIRLAEAAKQENAIKVVAPEFDALGQSYTATSANGEEAVVFPVLKDGVEVGAAVQAKSKKAFSGTITLMFGFDKEGTLTGFNVLQSAETPGLGSKIPQWFGEDNKGNKGKGYVIGKNPATSNLRVKKDGGDVDAITAATISSRAFLDALSQAYGVYKAGGNAPATDACASASTCATECSKACETEKVENNQ